MFPIQLKILACCCIFMLLTASYYAKAQTHLPLTNGKHRDLFGALNQNPADWESCSSLYLSPFATHAWLGGSQSVFGFDAITGLSKQVIREKIINNVPSSTGWAGMNVYGPALFIPLNKKFAVSFSTKIRLFANYWNVDGRLLSEINESHTKQQVYPYSLNPFQQMQESMFSSSELATNIMATLYAVKKHTLRFGASAIVAKGLAHTSLKARLNGGTVNQVPHNTNLVYLKDSQGEISTFSSGKIFKQQKLANLFKGSASLLANLGLVYEYKNKESDSNYQLKIALSVSDIGKMKFSPDSAYSKAYNVEIHNNSLFFNYEFDNLEFYKVSEILDKFPERFVKVKNHQKEYRITTPTVFRLNIDYVFSHQFACSWATQLGLSKQHTIEAQYNYNSVTLTPRYETNKYSIYAPIGVQTNTGWNSGCFISTGCLSIGSGNLFSSLLGNARQIDGYFALHFKLGNKNNTTN